jgi:hypothetical protein
MTSIRRQDDTHQHSSADSSTEWRMRTWHSTVQWTWHTHRLASEGGVTPWQGGDASINIVRKHERYISL